MVRIASGVDLGFRAISRRARAEYRERVVICIVKCLFSGLINGNIHYPQGEVKPEIGASVFFLALRGQIKKYSHYSAKEKGK
jgi:hypothetical protein